MPDPALGTSFSADVRLHLLVGDRRLRLSHVGPDRLCLRDDCEVAPADATGSVVVDGEEHLRASSFPTEFSLATDP